MKLGWIALKGSGALVQTALMRLELIADTYLSVNTPAQQALPGLFEAAQGVRRQIRNASAAQLPRAAATGLARAVRVSCSVPRAAGRL